ncbi:TspO/MBR family protein [Nocardioides sp.]|uniref:TspO/MBR family protein n=1 Tax=Nocardioides sp. TaxID=35761 RepID=UPI0035295105
MTAETAATAADRLRQLSVTAAEIFCVVGTLVGVGVLGTRVEESSGGALAADATRLAPAGPAFSIWSVIYLGLAAYTVWQWIPAQAASPRLRATGWLAAASMILNAAWLLVTQQGWIWASVAVIALLVVCLGVLAQRLADHPASSTAERVVVDTTFGLYLGWVTVATCANVTAALVESGVDPRPAVADTAAVLVLALATVILAAVARRLRGDWAVAAAAAWGLSWIAVGRLTGEPASLATGVAAILAAGMVLLANGYLARSAGQPAT